jgi:hypothetical protein
MRSAHPGQQGGERERAIGKRAAGGGEKRNVGKLIFDILSFDISDKIRGTKKTRLSVQRGCFVLANLRKRIWWVKGYNWFCSGQGDQIGRFLALCNWL